jgi:hypothetical protein
MQDIPCAYVINYNPSFSSTYVLASMIKFPPENKPEAYKDLVCTETDLSNIHEIITMMAENGKLSLLLKKNYLQNLGAQINHVHPLKFLSSIISDQKLKACLYEVFGDYFKRNGFMDGIGPSLSRESDKGKLHQYIPDFCEEINVPQDHLSKYFVTRDWEGLVRFLINRY